MMPEVTFAQAVATSTERKAIGATEVYLGDAPLTEMNWDYCSAFETGGGHRMDLCVSGYFIFEIDGLRLRRHFDLEKREANGMGQYMIDTQGIMEALAHVYGTAREQFLAYLGDCADAVKKKGLTFLDEAEHQFGMAEVLTELASHTRREKSSKK